MKLKTQEVTLQNGTKMQAVVLDQTGHPVYVLEDGTEVGQDVARLREDLKSANAESRDRRLKLSELEGQLKTWEGLDIEQVRKALDTVANLKDKDFMDAGKVEQLKAAINDAWQKKVNEGQAEVDRLKTKIRDQLIKGAFLSSAFIKDQTTMPAEAVYAWLGDRFTVEQGDNGEDSVIARLNGEPVFSPANPKNYASPEEAIEIMMKAHPQRATFLRASQASGSGAVGGSGTGTPRSTIQQLQEQYNAAVKSGDMTTVVALKKQMEEVRIKQQGGVVS